MVLSLPFQKGFPVLSHELKRAEKMFQSLFLKVNKKLKLLKFSLENFKQIKKLHF
jgi:hypothetical protein